MSKNTKLELTWIGKENRPKLEPRILIEDPDKSYHAARRVTDSDIFDNRLIHGDNLLALKALEQELAGKVRCVAIDPPYNTGSAFTHYDDGVEHSLWLTLMKERLHIIWRLLSEDGSLWITIDDTECHYLKVLLDEIFGRKNFVSNVVWQKKYAPANDSIWLSDSHDHILVYAKDKSVWRPQKLVRGQRADAAYKNPDGDERGAWKAGDYTCAKTAEERPNLYYPITNPNTGEIVWPSRSRVWAYGEEQHRQNEADRLVWWGKTGRNKVPSFKRFLSTVEDGLVCPTVWTWQEVGHTQDGRKEQLALSQGDPFPTPKPEQLMSRILEVGSLPGDLILDAFAGSGTTGAVAHKMHRRWIMIELGDHAETHVLPRLRKVVDGADPGGITDSVGWKGGGGFRYYRLAPSLLERDQWDNWVISKQFNPAMLAEAVCKLEGFTYAPSQERYWQHGHSTERDYIYVTTQKLTHQQLHALSEEVGPERSLLVCCAAFRGSADQWPNLTLKKIPKAVMDRCEWGRDDYSLSISNLPAAESLDVNGDANPPTAKKKAAPKKTKVAGQADLFGGEGEEA